MFHGSLRVILLVNKHQTLSRLTGTSGSILGQSKIILVPVGTLCYTNRTLSYTPRSIGYTPRTVRFSLGTLQYTLRSLWLIPGTIRNNSSFVTDNILTDFIKDIYFLNRYNQASYFIMKTNKTCYYKSKIPVSNMKPTCFTRIDLKLKKYKHILFKTFL